MDAKALNQINYADFERGYELNGIELGQYPLASLPLQILFIPSSLNVPSPRTGNAPAVRV